MGARDLYLAAEVYDVGRNGDTRKPLGRVVLPANLDSQGLIF